MRVFDLACATPWAITTEALEVILAIAARDDVPLRAVEAVAGRKLDNTRSVSYRSGTAIIPINGSIVRHGDMFSDVSGAVSVNTLAQDFTAALNDRSVRSILFSIDSPGGEINGIHEFADMVYAARSEKPIQAYISHLGCSAAYWIASATGRVICDATASVGSIGVVAAVPNPEKDPKRTVEFVSSQSPRKRADITTERGRADIQDRIDALADVFIASVARNRGVAPQKVQDDFGGGGVFVGAAAQKAGLVDSVGSFEATLVALAAADAPGEFAAKREGSVEKGAEREPRRLGRLMGWLNGGEDSVLDAIPTAVAEEGQDMAQEEETKATIPSAPRQAQPPDDPRFAEMERKLALANERAYVADAERLVTALIHGGQIVPASASAWRELYVACAKADDASGQATLAPALSKALTSSPVVHKLHGERLASGKYVALANRTETPTSGLSTEELDKEEEETRAWAGQRNRNGTK